MVVSKCGEEHVAIDRVKLLKPLGPMWTYKPNPFFYKLFFEFEKLSIKKKQKNKHVLFSFIVVYPKQKLASDSFHFFHPTHGLNRTGRQDRGGQPVERLSDAELRGRSQALHGAAERRQLRRAGHGSQPRAESRGRQESQGLP